MKPTLTVADWQEIYYAVDHYLRNMPPPVPAAAECSAKDKAAIKRQGEKETREWERHLKSILRKLGPDAENMTRKGE